MKDPKDFHVPNCPKCGQPCDSCQMEAIVSPPAPTMYLNTWSCTKCKEKK